MTRFSFASVVVLCALVACGGPAGPPGASGPEGPGGEGPKGPAGEDGGDGEDGGPRSLVFAEVGFAATDEQKREVRSAQTAWVDGAEVPIAFHPVLRTGDVVGDNVFGRMIDRTGAPIRAEDGSEFRSVDSDFTSLLDVGGELWSITHFESTPGGMYLSRLAQDPTTGLLSALSTEPIDFSGVGGLWTPCAGSVSPWGTHLGSEEYPPDARAWGLAEDIGDLGIAVLEMLRYFGLDIYTDADLDGVRDLELSEAQAVFDPYAYGFVTELSVQSGGVVGLTKHYTLGRVAIELAKVMPDERTVYLTDDGTNVGLFLFVADAPQDLSAGTLYAMKWYQTSAEGAGRADLGWISLGHATDAEIAAQLAGGVTFDDLFDSIDPLLDATSGDPVGCPVGYTATNAGDALLECLAVRPGRELAASRLETRRYAALLGATTELRKEEGIAHDPLTNTLYVSVSAIERGMEDFAKGGVANPAYDVAGPNDVRLPFNECGAVYSLDLAWNETIGSAYVAENMNGLLAGLPTNYPPGTEFAGNACSISAVANPDNLAFVNGYATLVVGEDSTTGHQNDVVWSYDLLDARLDRILSAPYGAENTSLYWYGDLGGFGYLVSVVQHPYGESDRDELVDPADARAYVGFVGPFPSMNP